VNDEADLSTVLRVDETLPVDEPSVPEAIRRQQLGADHERAARADDPKAVRLRRHFDGVSFTILVRAAPQGHELTGCPDVLALVLVPEDGDEDDLDGEVDHGVDREPVRAVAEPDGAHADLRAASHEGEPKVGRSRRCAEGRSTRRERGRHRTGESGRDYASELPSAEHGGAGCPVRAPRLSDQPRISKQRPSANPASGAAPT
jgi:hypothetical protein